MKTEKGVVGEQYATYNCVKCLMKLCEMLEKVISHRPL